MEANLDQVGGVVDSSSADVNSSIQTDATATQDVQTAKPSETPQVKQDVDYKAEFEKLTAERNKFHKENVRLANALKNLQIEKSTQTEPVNTVAQQRTTQIEDDDGYVTAYGAQVTKELADFLGGLQSEVQSLKTEREQSVKAAIYNEAVQDVNEWIKDVRQAAFKDLPDSQAQKFDKFVSKSVISEIKDAVSNGVTLSTDFIDKTINSTFAEAAELFGVFGTLQAKDNQQFKEQVKVKSGDGIAGTAKLPDLSDKNLSRSERRRMAAEIALKAEAMS